VVRRALAGLALLAVASCRQAPPTTNGVDLTITLDSSFKSAVTSVVLNVSGAETFTTTLNASAFPSGTGHIHYVPGVKSGTIQFDALALEGSNPVGSGSSGPVVLVAGKASTAAIAVGTTVVLPDMSGPDLGPPCPCMAGQYCDATNHCQPLKAAGSACGGTLECYPGLTCLDSVCCTVAVCGQCSDCAAGTGMCTVPVVNAPDPTGNACAGANTCDPNSNCLLALGQACQGDAQCASAHCVDGLCCGVASCPTCVNCGTDGTCSVPVKNADDTSANTCSGINSCDPTGTCKPRWQLIATKMGYPISYWGMVGAIGNLISINDVNNATSYTYDVTNNTFVADTGNTSDICGCGGTGYIFPANNKLYYIGNSGHSWDPTAASPRPWNAIATPPSTGEAAWSAVGTIVYTTGGRNTTTVVDSYNTTANTWTTTGLAAAPSIVNWGTAGTALNRMYVMNTSNKHFYYYDPAGNAWTTLPDAPDSPSFLQYMYTWRNKLEVFTNSGIRLYDPTAATWDPTPIPFPGGLTNYRVVVAGPNGDLFVLGDDSSSNVNIYKWVFN
jgi:hypothetical protein